MVFGKKTADDVLRLFAALSDEEKAKVLDGIKEPCTEDERQTAEAETDRAEKGEENGTADQSAQDIENERVGEQERLDGDQDSQPVQERIEESEGIQKDDEEAAEESVAESENATTEDGAEDKTEVLQTLASRLEAAEAKIAALEEALSDRVKKDNDQDFGSSPSVPSSGEGGNRMAEVMRGYAGSNARRYL